MADSSGKKGSDIPDQHPYVERLRPDPSKPPRPAVTLTGLLGRSDRDGHQRLYFTRDLGTYAEFPSSDVIFVEPVPAAESPIKGIDASRVTLSHDAPIHYTRSTKATALGDFDLNVRTARARTVAGPRPFAETWEAECPGPSFFAPCQTDFTCVCGDTVQITICRGRTCIDVCTNNTCRTDCEQATCDTCDTQCGTCRTCAGQNTCQTCQTQCDTCQTCDPTCNTCQTDCRGRTCITCDTCNRHVNTCDPRCF